MRCPLLMALLALCPLPGTAPTAEKGATLSGTIRLDGKAPPPKVVVPKGANIKDKEICAAKDIVSEKLVVDPQSNGIANVYVFMKVAPSGYKLPAPKQKVVQIDQKGCVFKPHASILLTNQQLNVISSDNCAHSFRINPFKNRGLNTVVGANDNDGLTIDDYTTPERLPTKVDCAYHEHMEGWVFIINHPFVAITDAQGQFTIPDIPPGEHEFTIWQPASGYIEKTLKIKLKAGEERTLDTIQVPLEKFDLGN